MGSFRSHSTAGPSCCTMHALAAISQLEPSGITLSAVSDNAIPTNVQYSIRLLFVKDLSCCLLTVNLIVHINKQIL